MLGYEGYFVNEIGEIFSNKNDTMRKLSIFYNDKGYARVGLMKDGKQKQVFVHRLVVEAFITEIPKGFYVNHIDGNKANNHVSNLEIVTQSENSMHSFYVLGNIISPVIMLDKDSFNPIKEFESIALASRVNGIDEGAIHKVCSMERNFAGGYSWILKKDYNEENIKKKINRLECGKGRKRVCQIDKDTNQIIRVFPGIREAERAIGVSSIKHCVTGRIKTAAGFKWRYFED